MIAEDFEKAATMVAAIDLKTDDAKYALQRAGFKRGYGRIFLCGDARGE